MGPVIRNVIRDCIRPVMGDEALASRFVGPLDGFDTSAFVLTTAVLFNRQIGQPMFRIRRSADDNHCDVLPDTRTLIKGTYFVGLDSPVNNFETASAATTLGEFVASAGYSNPDSLGAASDWFCRTAYDPSGNARDAEQTTAASQPQMGSAGSLVTDANGNITLKRFDGVPRYLSLTDPGFTTLDAFCVYSASANGGYIFGNNVNTLLAGRRSSGTAVLRGSSVILDGGTHGSDVILGNFLFNGASSLIRKNGSQVASGTTDAVGAFTEIMQAINLTTANGDLTASAIIAYPSDQSANRAAIEAKLAEIYGITLA